MAGVCVCAPYSCPSMSKGSVVCEDPSLLTRMWGSLHAIIEPHSMARSCGGGVSNIWYNFFSKLRFSYLLLLSYMKYTSEYFEDAYFRKPEMLIQPSLTKTLEKTSLSYLFQWVTFVLAEEGGSANFQYLLINDAIRKVYEFEPWQPYYQLPILLAYSCEFLVCFVNLLYYVIYILNSPDPRDLLRLAQSAYTNVSTH